VWLLSLRTLLAPPLPLLLVLVLQLVLLLQQLVAILLLLELPPLTEHCLRRRLDDPLLMSYLSFNLSLSKASLFFLASL
jgi:hypothetical protein